MFPNSPCPETLCSPLLNIMTSKKENNIQTNQKQSSLTSLVFAPMCNTGTGHWARKVPLVWWFGICGEKLMPSRLQASHKTGEDVSKSTDLLL